MNDDRAAHVVVMAGGAAQTVSDAAGASSWSWIGPSGMTVEIACL
jgi:hypothetical protein